MPATELAAQALLYREVKIPEALLTTGEAGGAMLRYGGDVRIGDLTGDGHADLLVYRCEPLSGLKPCFLGAFTLEGRLLWQAGSGGTQPLRPGPVAIHDIDSDGRSEVICFFHDPSVKAPKESLADVVVQIRDGRTGAVRHQAAPAELCERCGWGPNWCHQRLLMANLRGGPAARDFIVKLGDTILAFDDRLAVSWRYGIRWNDYGRCSAYIPAVGDLDGDGRDEINGGYFALNSDGAPLWEKPLAPHMDSVAVAEWDNGHMRAICSGGGHVMDAEGNVVFALGQGLVPHGQEVRVADFVHDVPGPKMAIRYLGHAPDVMMVSSRGTLLGTFQMNSSPNETGMEAVYWNGPGSQALLHNGGLLFDGRGRLVVAPPGLPDPMGPAKIRPSQPKSLRRSRLGWYHCIAADICGDEREEMLLYNPWADSIFIYTPGPLHESAYGGFHAGPRQYNPRLMD